MSNAAASSSSAAAFWQYCRTPADENPYDVIFLGLWDIFAAKAAAEGKAVAWVANTGEMCAKAKNNWRRLRPFDREPECMTWGELYELHETKPDMLAKVVFVADVDFEPDNQTRMLIAKHGTVQTGAIARFVHGLVRDKRRAWLWVHREGWNAVFDVDALKILRDTGRAPALPLTEKERDDEGQAIMSGRVGGPVLLGVAVGLWQGEHQIGAVLAGLAGLGCTYWAYTTKLPKP
jgi:hypothetical protein